MSKVELAMRSDDPSVLNSWQKKKGKTGGKVTPLSLIMIDSKLLIIKPNCSSYITRLSNQNRNYYNHFKAQRAKFITTARVTAMN